jgi:hypothetical protein
MRRLFEFDLSHPTRRRWEAPVEESRIRSVNPIRRLYRVATGWGSRAARLFLRLLEMVRSMIAPQLMHFHA